VYAFVLAIISQRSGIHLPPPVFRAVAITGDASIPILLIVLGIQLAETQLERSVNVFLAVGIRLCIGPIIAFGLAQLIGLEGTAAKVFILQMSGPVAVGMGAYGVQFDVAPRF